MAYNTGDLVTRVQERIRDTGYSSTEIKNYLNDVQNDVFNEYSLRFMETSQNYTLNSGVSDITDGNGLPSNFVQGLNLYLTSEGREKVLTYRDTREIDEMHPDPDDTSRHPAGVPNEWYFFADTIRVYPVPDDDYTVTLRYFKKPTALSADGDVPELPSEFEELFVVGASYRVLQVKDNYDQAGILQNKYDEILDKLVAKYNQPQIGTPVVMRINRHAHGTQNF